MFNGCKSMLAFVFAVSSVGCFAGAPMVDPSDSPEVTPGVTTENNGSGYAGDPGASSGGAASGEPDNTFDHMNLSVDPYEVLARLQVEGPPEIATRMHSCSKIMYATFGNVLRQFGVSNTTGNGGTAGSAGPLYRNGSSALGAPSLNYVTLLPESTLVTAAGQVKLMDIGIQAAADMLNVSRANTRIPAYRYAGTDYGIIDRDAAEPTDTTKWTCNRYGISALLGVPATQIHLDLCNAALQDFSSAALGANGITNGLRANEVLAVAQVFNAGIACE